MVQQKQLIPFRFGTRQHFAYVGSIPHTSGGQISFRLPNVGFLTKLYLQFNGQINAGATAPVVFPDWRYPFALASRISLSANVGNTDIVNASGPMLKLVDRTYRRSLIDPYFGLGGVGAETVPSTISVSTATPLVFSIPINVTPNDGSNFDEGCINLQSTELQVNLNVTLSSESGLFSTVNGATITGTWNLYYKYYEVPDPNTVAYPVAMWHAQLSQPFQFNSSGDNTYTIPLQGTLLRLYMRFYNANASVTSFDASKLNNLSVKFDKATTIYQIPAWRLGEENTMAYPQWSYGTAKNANAYPKIERGAMVLDLFNASDLAGHGDTRDAINTQAIAATDFVFNMLSYDAGDYVEIMRQIVAPFIVTG